LKVASRKQTKAATINSKCQLNILTSYETQTQTAYGYVVSLHPF
jgi:hypothetical protein